MISQEQYIDAWEHNAKQHFVDGDYEWVCNQINHYKTVFEIGCGAGYSTLALAIKQHNVLSIDLNPVALQSTISILKNNHFDAELASHTIDFGHTNIWLWECDVVSNCDTVAAIVNQLPIDLILLCNPGGNLDPELRKCEANLLLKCGFSLSEIDERYHEGNVPLLHKFSLIDAAASIAIKCDLPFMFIERGSKIQINEEFSQIAIDTNIRMIQETKRRIRKEPEGGIILGDADGEKSEELYWGAGLFFPK